jgi:hypothetical protein
MLSQVTLTLFMLLHHMAAVQVATCNGCDCQDWYVDTVGRLHPLHAPQLCLDIVSGKTAIRTCSTALTQSWVGLGERLVHVVCQHTDGLLQWCIADVQRHLVVNRHGSC